MAQRFNIFAKELTNSETGRKFIVHFTKVASGNFYDVRFVDGCDDDVEIPSGKKPFVLVVDDDKVSVKVKEIKNEDGSTFTKRIMYIRMIKDIEEYIEEPVDFSSL